MKNTTRPSKQFVSVNGQQMAYVDQGKGTPVVFLHGNPTSSYLWRNVMPHIGDRGRCLAPDLIGMGDSDKLPHAGPGTYRFVTHRQYLDAWFDAVVPEGAVTLVIHDWGSALGFDWARRHPARVRGIAYMEAIVKPMSWAEWPEVLHPIFRAFRSEAGETMVLDKNVFVEKVLPGSILRTLDEAEMAEYRRPFKAPGEGRRPTLDWPRDIPLDRSPEDTTAVVEAYGRWMTESALPKLFVNANPGAILIGAARDFCRQWPNQREVTVKGSHFIQEDAPDDIGHAIADWLDTLA
jgi:haloalkane dehalogenase